MRFFVIVVEFFFINVEFFCRVLNNPTVCDEDEEEDVTHFTSRCSVFERERQLFINIVKQRLKDDCGEEGARLLTELNWVEGRTIVDLVIESNTIRMSEIAAGCVRRAVMNYLSKIWKIRTGKFGGNTKFIKGRFVIEKEQ